MFWMEGWLLTVRKTNAMAGITISDCGTFIRCPNLLYTIVEM